MNAKSAQPYTTPIKKTLVLSKKAFLHPHSLTFISQTYQLLLNTYTLYADIPTPPEHIHFICRLNHNHSNT